MAHYLRHVISRNRYLRLQGIRSGGKLVYIELEEIYVTLRATRKRTVEAERAWLEEEASLAPGETLAPGEAPLRHPEHGPRTHTETVTVSVEEALASDPRLVILGDPGSGKTTLLRYLALLYARDLAEGETLVQEHLGLEESGCLPILLPLRRVGAYLKAHRPVDDGTEGHALLLRHCYERLKGERVERFLCNWHRAVAVGQMGPGRSAEAYAEKQTQALLTAIWENERIRDLDINPLMLTVIALVHRDRVKLPDRWAELYDEAVNVLLGKWDEARGVQEIAILEDRPFDAGDRRLMLQAVALWMQEQEQKEVEADDLRRLLGERFHDILGDWRAVERAGDPWWREVILLEAGHLSTQSRERTTRLIEAIAERGQEPEPYHNLVLAAECLRDVGPGRVGDAGNDTAAIAAEIGIQAIAISCIRSK